VGSFLASSVETVFHRNDLREVQSVIDRNPLENRDILLSEAKPFERIMSKD
jgi:hypothetical protein